MSALPDLPERIPNRLRSRDVVHPGRWIATVIVAIIALAVVEVLLTNDRLDWATVNLYLRDVKVIQGVGYTLLLTVVSMVIATALAVTLAIMRRSDNPVLRGVAWVYIWFFRGTPIYTQLVFWGMIAVLFPTIGVGLPFLPDVATVTTKYIYSAFWAAIAGLALNEAAYLAEIVRSGLDSVDPGQEEAARALGMSGAATMRRIILPQAMRVIVPPLGNETIGMLKTTSLVLAVPFTHDLQYATTAIANLTLKPIPLLIIAAIWYLVITSVLMVGQHYLEKYFGRGTGGGRAGGKNGRRRQRAIAASGTTPSSPLPEVEL